jgi:hypothetical protein
MIIDTDPGTLNKRPNDRLTKAADHGLIFYGGKERGMPSAIINRSGCI